MMEFQWVTFEKAEGIATITLNRPDSLNALVPLMRVEIRKAIEDVAEDDDIRVLVLTGAGRGFCAGADVATVAEGAEMAEDEPRRERLLRTVATARLGVALLSLNKPTIAAVNGVAAGAGTALALACDIIIASDQARFRVAFTRMGLCPGDGVTYLLPRAIGVHKALELIYTNDVIDAKEMERIGLVNKVVPHDNLMREARELGKRTMQIPPLTLALAKQAVYKSAAAHDIETQIALETLRNKTLRETEDQEEAMNLPTASCGVSLTQILAPSSLEFALQRLKTLLATPPQRFLPPASWRASSPILVKSFVEKREPVYRAK